MVLAVLSLLALHGGVRDSAQAADEYWLPSPGVVPPQPFDLADGANPGLMPAAPLPALRLPPPEAGLTAAAAVQPAGYVNEALAADPAAADPDKKYMTLDELRAEMKKLAWTKGDFKIVPYGHLSCDMIYETQRTNPGAFTLWVLSGETPVIGGAPPQLVPRETGGEGTFIIDARRSRLGFDVTGPTIPWCCGLKTGGRAEVDFFGNFPTENRGGILLRHIYAEAKNDDWRFLVGQTWDVISPLLPGTLSYSVGWGGGNIGFRHAQFRAERYLAVSDDLLFTIQGSLNQDIGEDFQTDASIRREAANWPVVDGRFATTIGQRGEGCHPMTIGVSGHIGETGFDFLTAGPVQNPAGDRLPPEDDARFLTWSFNVDARVPLTDRWGVQGEFFTGANLSQFLGGIVQGVCPCLRVPIRTSGGWLETWYDWTPRLHSSVGAGVDNPVDEDSLVGRTFNGFLFANLKYDITKQFLTGFEVTCWRTEYHDVRGLALDNINRAPSEPGTAVMFEWLVQYGF